MISPSTISFLKSLKKNNNKPWFDNNRDKYLIAKNNFEELITELLHKMTLYDDDMKELTVKDCCFRINRDIRFSKNKTPYKISLSASFNKGGRKSIYAGYYLHLQPEGKSFADGGLWHPEAAELKKIRQEIDYCLPEFKKIIHATAFKKNYGELERDENHMLKKVPKGYDKDNAAAGFLKMKSFVATRNIPEEVILSTGFSDEIIRSFKALQPLVHFLNRAFE